MAGGGRALEHVVGRVALAELPVDLHDADATAQAHQPDVHLAADAEAGDGRDAGQHGDDGDQHPPDGVGAEEERQRGRPEEHHADRRREPRRAGILELGGRAQAGLDDRGVEAQHRAVLRAEGGAEEQHHGEQRGDPLLLEHEAEHEGGGEHRLVGAGPTRVDGCGGGGGGHGHSLNPTQSIDNCGSSGRVRRCSWNEGRRATGRHATAQTRSKRLTTSVWWVWGNRSTSTDSAWR